MSKERAKNRAAAAHEANARLRTILKAVVVSAKTDDPASRPGGEDLHAAFAKSVTQDANPGVRRDVIGAEEQEAHRRHTLVAGHPSAYRGRVPLRPTRPTSLGRTPCVGPSPSC